MAFVDVELELRKYSGENKWGYEVGVVGSEDCTTCSYNMIQTADGFCVLWGYEDGKDISKQVIINIRPLDKKSEINELAYKHAKKVVVETAKGMHLNFEKNRINSFVDNTPQGKGLEIKV